MMHESTTVDKSADTPPVPPPSPDSAHSNVDEQSSISTSTSEEEERVLWNRLAGFKYGLFVSRCAKDGRLRTRPMAVVKYDQLHSDVWFLTHLGSSQQSQSQEQEQPEQQRVGGRCENTLVEEIEEDPNVAICFEEDQKTFISLTAHASIIKDRASIDQLWTESLRIWFPLGKEDPLLVAIRAVILDGEYWDYGGIFKQLRFLTEAGRAWFESRPVDSSKFTDHAKISKVPQSSLIQPTTTTSTNISSTDTTTPSSTTSTTHTTPTTSVSPAR